MRCCAADRTQSMLIMNVTVGVTGLVMMAFAGLPSSATVYVLASGIIHLLYNALLVRMYRSGDLGETYPVACGSSPALVALGGSLFAGEWMNLLGTVGIGLVCAGIFIARSRKRPSACDEPAGGAGDRRQHCRLHRCRWHRRARFRPTPEACSRSSSSCRYGIWRCVGGRYSRFR
jgi:multidrug transporter EmrE-like cation transporter